MKNCWENCSNSHGWLWLVGIVVLLLLILWVTVSDWRNPPQ